MNTNGAEMLQPVFEFLDTQIAQHGHILYMGLVYASIPLIAWLLSGGLRRRPARRDSASGISIVVIRPPARPPSLPPPLIQPTLTGVDHMPSLRFRHLAEQKRQSQLIRQEKG